MKLASNHLEAMEIKEAIHYQERARQAYEKFKGIGDLHVHFEILMALAVSHYVEGNKKEAYENYRMLAE